MKRNIRPQRPTSQMVAGMRPLMEAIRSGKEIEKVLIQKDLRGDLFKELRAMMGEPNFPVQIVPQQKLDGLTKANHQGVIAFLSAVSFTELSNVIADIFEKGEVPKLLLLDGITDVRNFGAICRTAECLGFHAVVVPEKGSAQVNEDAVKTSAGALLHLPLCRVKSVMQTIAYLQDSGLRVAACTEKAQKPLSEVDFSHPICVVMGSEEMGISQEILRKADDLTLIPMYGKTSSLNVSVAAGMIMYEVNRQRLKATLS